MEVARFEIFINETRKEFAKLISDYLNGFKDDMKKMIKNKLENCTTEFEEEVLLETLQDEFNQFMERERGK